MGALATYCNFLDITAWHGEKVPWDKRPLFRLYWAVHVLGFNPSMYTVTVGDSLYQP